MRANLLASATVTSRAGRRALQEPLGPGSQWIGPFVEPPQARRRSEDEEASQIGIALLGNPAQPFLSTAGVLSRNQTQPRREVSPRAAHGGIGHMRPQGGANTPADAG